MEAVASSEVFLFEEFRLDRRGGGLFRRDDSGAEVPVAIGSRALDILQVLIARPGDLVSKDEIIAAVWPGTIVEESNLTVQISALRRILDPGRSQGSCIQTVSGRGYRFLATVAQPTAEVEPAALPADAAPRSGAPDPTDTGFQRRFSRSLLGAAGPSRRLAAILALDVAGYSLLMGADEEGTHERLKAHNRRLVEPRIRERQGRIVKTTGDGMLVEFHSVVDAVCCAAELQRGMIDREPQLAVERRIKFRIGINLGDIIAERGDIFGDGVNVAARLEALAEPGGVCVSRVVRDQIRDKLPFPLKDMGEQSVKNIGRPVRVYALRPETIAALPASTIPTAAPRRRRAIGIAIAAVAVVLVLVSAWRLWPAGKPFAAPETMTTASTSQPFVAPRLSIVVLPFANLGNDPEQQYFADGITEDLTTDLSRIPDMFVISRNTALTYRDKPVSANQIGRELGVRYVLEGSVQRVGAQARINAQLIGADTNAHLWAERFDRDTADFFALQDEVTRGIAGVLNVELIAAEVARPTEHPDALDYIFRGRAAGLRPWSREGYDEAISMFERALQLDPHSAEAKSLLAVVLTSRVLGGVANSPAADIAHAEALTAEALVAAPRSSLTHFAKGQVLRVQHRYAEAIPEYETALASNRNSAGALFALGLCWLYTGAIEKTIPLEQQAIRLSPRDPQVGIWYQQIGRVHLLQSRTDEAILWFERARSAHPGLPFIRAELASAYGLKGGTERAAAELAEARRLSTDDRYTSIARLKASGTLWAPRIYAVSESTYFAGLRKAGMPE